VTLLGMQVEIAGLAALVNSLVLVPSILALRKIAKGHDERIVVLETPRARTRKRARRAR
jgi:hypothetical protein